MFSKQIAVPDAVETAYSRRGYSLNRVEFCFLKQKSLATEFILVVIKHKTLAVRASLDTNADRVGGHQRVRPP